MEMVMTGKREERVVDISDPLSVIRFLFENRDALVERGLVRVKRGFGELDNLYIFIYTNWANRPAVFRDSPFMFYTRGLVVDENGEPVSVPFHKFFNLHDSGVLGLPKWVGDEKIYLKLDGTLVVVTFNPHTGKPLIHTKGTLEESIFTRKFREYMVNKGYWNDLVNFIEKYPDATLMFELLGDGPPGLWIRLGKSPSYEKKAVPVLLAIRPSPVDPVQPAPVKELNIPNQLHPLHFDNIDEVVRFVKHNPNLEGFVTYSMTGRIYDNPAWNLMWKVKSIEYMRRLVEKPSKNVYEAVLALLELGFRDDIENDPDLSRALKHLERINKMKRDLGEALEEFRRNKEFRTIVLETVGKGHITQLFRIMKKGYPATTSLDDGEKIIETGERVVELFKRFKGQG